LKRKTFFKPSTPKIRKPRLNPPKIRVMKSRCLANITAKRTKYNPTAVKSREMIANPVRWRMLNDSPFLSHAVLKELL
jgi:hypothetical protein